MKFGWLTLAHSPRPSTTRRASSSSSTGHARRGGRLRRGLAHRAQFTGESVYVDPIPFAAALAMRTSRIRIGFAVIQMALRHPVRLATQLSVLDNLTRGTPRRRRRPRLVVQRVRVPRLRAQKPRCARADGRGARGDDAGLDGQPLDHKGKYFTVRLPELPRARAAAAPADLAQRGVAASFRICGGKGVPILTSRLPLAQIGARLGQYAEGLGAAGSTARRRNGSCGGRDLAMGLRGREPRGRRGRARRRACFDASPHAPRAPGLNRPISTSTRPC